MTAAATSATATYRLVGADSRPYCSSNPGALGGHARNRVYGRLDCPSALRWLARGHYAAHRVFFADEATARAAGYRPCAVCLPRDYAGWRTSTKSRGPRRERTPATPSRSAPPRPEPTHPTAATMLTDQEEPR